MTNGEFDTKFGEALWGTGSTEKIEECPTCGGYGFVESPHATADMPCPDTFHSGEPEVMA